MKKYKLSSGCSFFVFACVCVYVYILFVYFGVSVNHEKILVAKEFNP